MKLFGFFFKPKPAKPPPSNVADFLAALAAIAPSPGRGDYVFPRPAGGSHGFVQFLARSIRVAQCKDRFAELHDRWDCGV